MPSTIVGRVVVTGRGLGGLEAAALINGHVDENRAGLHVLQFCPGHQLGCGGPGDQHGADHHVGLGDEFRGGRTARVAGAEVAAEDVVEVADPGQRAVEDGHVRAHTRGHAGGMGPHDAATDHHDIAGAHARDAAQEHAPAAIGPLERPGADLRRELARHLGHRCEKREAALRVGHRLVGDGGDTGGQKVCGLRRIGGEVEISEEDLARAQALALLGLGLLHLHNHLGLGKDVLCRWRDLGPDRRVGLVGEPRARPGAGLDQHLVAVPHRFTGRARRHANPVLPRLDFLWTPDLHGSPPSLPVRYGARWKKSG